MPKTKREKATLEDVLKKFKNNQIGNKIVPTNIIVLDTLLKGGLELGSIVQFVSESGIGKTTTALYIAKNLCMQDYNVVYLDTEGSVSQEIIDSVDLNEFYNNKFFYIKESSFKNVEECLDLYISTDKISFVVVDSIAGLINDCYLDLNKGKSITENSTIFNSRPLVMFMNKYNALAKSKNICFIILNQYRNKVDITKGTILKEYGNKNVKYNSDVIIRINPIISTSAYNDFKSMRKYNENGRNLEFEIIKSNKMKPEIKLPLYLVYGLGISEFSNYVYALLKLNIIIQSAGYYQSTIDGVTYNVHGLVELLPKIMEQYKDGKYMEDIIDYYNKLVN